MGKYDKFDEIFYGKSNGTSQLAKNQKNINNYSVRLAAGGVDPSQVTDNRNWLEKGLNLKKDQNFIFDIFELINRPQQALFGGIENLQQGGDFLEGASQGITGNKDTAFKDILMNTGLFDDTTYEDLIKQGEDEGFLTRLKAIDLVDILGKAGDVFLDPMDIPLLPVSTAAKGAKALDTVSDVAKAADVVDTVGDVAKAANVLDTASDTAKAIEFISPTQALGKLAKKGIKGTASIADTGIEKLLKNLDEKSGILYKNADNKWASELGKIGEGVGKLETYKGIKNNITTMFNTKLSKAARQSQKSNEAREYLTNLYLEGKADDIYKDLEDTSSLFKSKGINKTVEEIDKDMAKIIDNTPEITLKKVITNAQDNTIKYTDEIYNKLVDAAKDIPDDTEKLINGIKKGENDVLQLSEDWNKVLDNIAPDKLDMKVKRASFLSEEAQKDIADTIKLYEENAPELVKKFKNYYNDANKFVEQQFKSMEGLTNKYLEGNIEGYSKHRMAEDYASNLKKLSTDYGVDLKDLEDYLPQNQLGIGTGTKTLNARKYEMSAQEANLLKKRELLNIPNLSEEAKNFIKNDINLFDTTATSGIQEYIKQMPKLAKNTQLVDEIMIKQGIGDLNKISNLKNAIKEGKDVAKNTEELNKLLDNSPFRLVEKGKPQYGFKKLDSDSKEMIVNFLKSTGNKTGNKDLIDMANSLKKLDNMAVDPTVLNIIKFNNSPQKNEFAKMYNKLIGFFKKNSTASLTNQMNNITGNMMNMGMSGMDMKDIATYSSRALKDLNNYEDILKRGITDISQLSKDELKTYNKLMGFIENVSTPDKASILRKYDIDGVMKEMNLKGNKNLYNKYVDAFATLNANEDRVFRYAMYNYAMDNPKFMRNLGIDIADNASDALKARAAGEAVGKVLFDPSDLTAFEQTTMKNIIPFYTFTKKNLAYQISNMGDNLQNYNKLMKAYNSTVRSYGDDYENMSQYLKDNMYIPIPIIGKNGDYSFIRAQLPFGDLTDLASDPLESLVNRSNPFAKGIYERVSNKNLLTGRDIESYPGQQGNIGILNELVNKVPVLEDIPILNKINDAKTQQLLGNLTGINTQLKMLDRTYQGYNQGGVSGALANNLTIQGNVNTDRLNKSYEQINNLKNLMKQYEQKGYQFSTLNELKKSNENNTISGLEALFAKYGIDTSSGNKKKTTYSEFDKLFYNK